jgi:hypothetical protein
MREPVRLQGWRALVKHNGLYVVLSQPPRGRLVARARVGSSDRMGPAVERLHLGPEGSSDPPARIRPVDLAMRQLSPRTKAHLRKRGLIDGDAENIEGVQG